METENKREKFIEKEKKGFEFKTIYVLPVILVLAILAGAFLSGGNFANNPQSTTTTVTVNTIEKNPESIVIPISEVNDGKAHFYTYQSSAGKTIRFFVVKSSDGIFRTAFDACDVCYAAKKGYRQEGDYMVCNNCGNKFPIAKIGEEFGGCNPSPLGKEISNGEITIKKTDIEKGNKFF